MHAVYSVSSDPRRLKRIPRTADDKVTSKTTYHYINHLSVSNQRSSLENMRTRRDKQEPHSLGDGKGTNIKMIQLIYDSFDRRDQFDEFEKTEKNNVSNKNDSSLVNPLVIGIGAFCGVLLIALIVVWILYKRKGRQDQAVQASAQAVSTPNSHGTQV